jgi:hypothetical protein
MNSSVTTPGGHADIPDLSRVAFFDGQRLAAADLNEAATVQRELRWLHNRSLHNWGIGLGFAVSGAAGDHQVRVEPGYAIDCRGREIILTEAISQAVPARVGGAGGQPAIYYLLAAYPDDARLAVLERRQGECGADGAVRLEERAAIYWKAQGEQTIASGEEIVLAQAAVQNCALASPLSLAQRRSARPAQQPYVAAGASPVPGTGWTAWTVAGALGTTFVGVRATVDTAAARFGGTPQYQARLDGPRLFLRDETFPNLPVEAALLLEGATSVTGAEPQRFTFNVILPRGLDIPGSVLVNPDPLFAPAELARLLAAVERHWSVVWLGVEG